MQRKRIASSLVTGIASEVANKIFPLLTLHFAAERLGVHSFGLSQFSQWLIDLAIFFVVFGYQNWSLIAWRNSTTEGRKTIFPTVVILRLVHAVLAILILMSALGGDSSWNKYQGVVLQSAFVILTSALDSTWTFTALNLLPILSFISIAAKTLSLVAIFALVRTEQDAGVYTFSTMSANALIAILTFWIAIRRVGWTWPTFKQLGQAFRGSLPYAISFFLLIALERFDLSLVEHYMGTEGAGAYGGPLKIAQSILPVAAMVTTVFFAEILGVYETESFLRHLRAGIRVAILIVSPIIAGVWFVDQTVVKLVIGDAFIPYANLLSIMTTSIMAQMFILAFGNQVLAIRGKMTWYNFALAIGIVVGIGFSIYVSTNGQLAFFAAASALGRWTTAIVIIVMAMQTLGNYRGIGWELIRSTIPATAMAGVLYALNTPNFFANVLVGAAVHCLLTTILFRETAMRVVRKIAPNLSRG